MTTFITRTHRSFPRPALAVPAALSLAAALLSQNPERKTVVTDGLAVEFGPAQLKGRSIEKDVTPGFVWRMGAGQAALLKADVPWMANNQLFAPGEYRLSARCNGPGTWDLLIFRGQFVFETGLRHRTAPLTLGTVPESREALAFGLSSTRVSDVERAARLEVAWGNHTLAATFRTFTSTKAEGTLAGKPAQFEIFRLPAERALQQRLTGGSRILFGTVRQTEANGVRFDLYGQVTEANGIKLVLRNWTLDDARVARDMGEKTLKGIEAHVAKGDAGGQLEEFKAWAAQVRAEIAAQDALLEKAKAWPSEIEIAGTAGQTAETHGTLDASLAKKEGDVPVLDVAFGRQSATFRLDHKLFR